MASKDKPPVTQAVRILREHGVPYSDHIYDYEERGGTSVSARELGVSEHAIVKTLVMEDETGCPLIVLMHGDMKVSTKALARVLAVKTIVPCDPAVANRHTGYMVGGTSPFGTRKSMPVFMERTIGELERIYVNGGRRGYLVGLAPAAASRLLRPVLVDVGIGDDDD